MEKDVLKPMPNPDRIFSIMPSGPGLPKRLVRAFRDTLRELGAGPVEYLRGGLYARSGRGLVLVQAFESSHVNIAPDSRQSGAWLRLTR